jgi:hypothetical protein
MDKQKAVEATKRPWKVAQPVLKIGAERTIQIGADSCDWRVGHLSCVLPNDCGIQDIEREERLKADAALIVRAVNNYDGLVAALEAVDESVFSIGREDRPPEFEEALAKVRQALAAARDE